MRHVPVQHRCELLQDAPVARHVHCWAASTQPAEHAVHVAPPVAGLKEQAAQLVGHVRHVLVAPQ